MNPSGTVADRRDSNTGLIGGCSSMVEPQPSKLMTWVRFPSPAPAAAGSEVVRLNGLSWRKGWIAPEARSSAHIAQSVEHFLGKEEVTGSSPVMGSTQQAVGLEYVISLSVKKVQVAEIHCLRQSSELKVDRTA